MQTNEKLIQAAAIEQAYERLASIVDHTPLQFNRPLSTKYHCNIYLKREDMQLVRSYKSRGAYNKISSLTDSEKKQGVVCASAGNHAQGFAFSCAQLQIEGKVFMPVPTPKQKVAAVQQFGGQYITIELTGDTFDDASKAANTYCTKHNKVIIPPFDDLKVIEGQGTVGFEILKDIDVAIDYIFMPVGGGGLSAGVGSYFKQQSPNTTLVGVEPSGAPAMFIAFKNDRIIKLDQIDKFVDGAAVQQVGSLTFPICKNTLTKILLVDEGMICTLMLELYNKQAMVVEPAGVLSIAALDQYADKIKGKNVVCIVSGGNNDILRTEEIKERSMLYEGLKHYFVIRFPQRAGALKEFVMEVLGPQDNISRFEYTKRNNRETGPALVGIELQNKADYKGLLERLEKHNFQYELVNDNPNLFNLLVCIKTPVPLSAPSPRFTSLRCGLSTTIGANFQAAILRIVNCDNVYSAMIMQHLQNSI